MLIMLDKNQRKPELPNLRHTHLVAGCFDTTFVWVLEFAREPSPNKNKEHHCRSDWLQFHMPHLFSCSTHFFLRGKISSPFALWKSYNESS